MGKMQTVIEYFLVCGLGPELQTSAGVRGYQGSNAMYMPFLLDQYPPASASDRPPPPPQLPLCVLPGGVEFHSNGLTIGDESSYPHSYPIVLTDGEGSKIYVSCIAFRDPVDDDIAEAYRIPANSYVDKCICIVSHSPCFKLFAEALEELHRLCFSPSGSSKPLWEIVAHMVTSVPLPKPGKTQVLFSIESRLLCVQIPPKEGLPHADMSFQPLVQCLDIDNITQVFCAILLERRVLLRANKYSLLTMVAEALCHLIYPVKWQHVYIPLLFYAGVDYIEAPTPYLMGLHSRVNISNLLLDGVVVVDLDNNQVNSSEEIPPLPDTDAGELRRNLVRLLYPNVVHLDCARKGVGDPSYDDLRRGSKPWNEQHDCELRLIFLKFFASILNGYRDYADTSHSSLNVFNTAAFLKRRTRLTGLPPEPMLVQFLSSQGFYDFLERGYGAPNVGANLVDKLQGVIVNGQNPADIFPTVSTHPEILSIADIVSKNPGARSRYCYDRFPANFRTPAQEEKRKQFLSAASASLDRPTRPLSGTSISSPVSKTPPKTSFSPRERAAERERMVLDIKVKLQGLWIRLLNIGGMDDPFSSFEYGTILALIESDAEGIGGSGFVECVREHINSGWECRVSEEQFTAVKELIKTTVNRATSRNDMETVRDALEISADIHRRDAGNIIDSMQRHLGSLPIWDDMRFWEGYFDHIMERCSQRTGNYATLVTQQLIIIIQHMAGLRLPDAEAWFVLESIGQKNNLTSKQLIKLRGRLTHLQRVKQAYWGVLPARSGGGSSQTYTTQDRQDNDPQPSEAAGIGRSWVQSMFSRDRATSMNSPSRYRSNSNVRGQQQSSNSTETPEGVKRGSSGLRILRGHTSAITALHVATRSEMGDLVSEFDAGFFISGSADCTVKIWDPSVRGSELKATLKGHKGAVRALSSDRLRVVSGSDDHNVLMWDKTTTQILEELKGHDERVSCVRMLSEERVLTASHDGTVRMWDARTDACVATIGQCAVAVLCMDFDDSARILAAAGVDGVAHIWDVRGGKYMHKLSGHTKRIRSVRIVKDTIVTGSDDWTARVWSVNGGGCEAVLACHAGGIRCVEYCVADNGIITGSADGMVRIWEHQDGTFECVKNVGIHGAEVMCVKGGERWLAIGAADNSMSLFHRSTATATATANSTATATATANSKTTSTTTTATASSWQLFRTPQRTAALVRCVACDADRGRICSGAPNGLLRLWEPILHQPQ